LVKLLASDGIHLNQNLADSYAVVGVIGADNATIVENQLALPFAASEAESAGFSGGVEELNYIHNG
jgi:hypothetical protein